MKALAYSRRGDASVLSIIEMPVPRIGAREVLVEVRATSVNPIDWKIRRGMMGPLLPLRRPAVPGLDFAGLVVEVGSRVTRFRAGDAVFGLMQPWSPRGAAAEFVAAREEYLFPKPEALDFPESAALPLAGLTALDGLHCAGAVAGERVLILGAAGGVGSYAVQIAKAQGAHVTAMCSSESLEFVRALKPDELIARDREEIGSRRFKVFFDAVGKSSFAAARANLIDGGIYLTTVQSPVTVLFMIASRLSLLRRRLRCELLFKPARRGMPELLEMFAAGRLRPMVQEVIPLEDGARAHRQSEGGRTRGKLVIGVSPPARITSGN